MDNRIDAIYGRQSIDKKDSISIESQFEFCRYELKGGEAKEYKDKAGEDSIKEIQDHVKKITAPYKYPRIIEFVDELPKTISGKIRRVEIRNKDKE